ncbi:MAG: cadmium-translocating P-type ATPase [Chitinophagaceae bacterium]|nr:cadmium-translocating P-type ATPase [Chitinophagaceae bacterium]
MEKIQWKVEGMTCTNCALSVNKVLTRQGMEKVKVNAITGEVFFETKSKDDTINTARKSVEGLGYTVIEEGVAAAPKKKKWFKNHLQRALVCLPFTLVLMAGHLSMTLGFDFLHNAWLQLVVCLPVMIIGMDFFGRSAIKSLGQGVPNMNVLIALGASAAFIYSLIGTITGDSNLLFYETAASIINIVFFGNWLEDKTIEKTQKSINELVRHEKVMANMIAYDDEHNEHMFPVENTHLKVGDLLLIKTGEQVPMDCKILSGEVEVNEAIISGESLPIFKKQNDILIGGSLIANGSVKCYVTAVGKDTVMNGIINMMKQAQNHKPPVQQLADKISAIFVPAVIAISLLTLAINMWAFNHTFQVSLMRSIAVLVISCPCAMGLATPAAIAVGLGRAAKNGILYTDTKSMELFSSITQMVFDKTGTLTNGQFKIAGFKSIEGDEETFMKTVFSLEKFSNHPIAKSITQQWTYKGATPFKKVEEVKGLGMRGEDKEGNIYWIGSSQIEGLDETEAHHLYVTKNNKLFGWIDIADEIRPEAKEVINFCKSKEIKTILLSGDSKHKCELIANELGIDEVYAERTPQQKLELITDLVQKQPTVMVGDGVNDAPALAKATISISLSQASQLAIKSATVVLMNTGLKNLPLAMQLGKHTYGTVKSNLFWAFLYNVIAIPVAAIGLLTPMAGALAMGLSDVVLAANSLWLNFKKLD